MKRWQYFEFENFACKCGCGENKMNEEFIDDLDALREACGFAFIVTSGYRCPKHNQKVSTTGPDGPHTTGLAVDIKADRRKAFFLTKMAMLRGFTGIGWQQKGAVRFVHLDKISNSPTSPRPTIWSY